MILKLKLIWTVMRKYWLYVWLNVYVWLSSMVQENVERQGLNAMNLSLDFDEVAVLQENMTYLHNTLEVSSVIVSSHPSLMLVECTVLYVYSSYTQHPQTNLYQQCCRTRVCIFLDSDLDSDLKSLDLDSHSNWRSMMLPSSILIVTVRRYLLTYYGK